MVRETILVVEHDADALCLMTDILRQAGYIVFCAMDGAQALELASQEQPDLILMDLHLPGMIGLTVARKLKGNPATASIPIGAVTAMELDREEAMGMFRDCVGYIPKPISPSSVIELVSTFLQTGRFHRERGKAEAIEGCEVASDHPNVFAGGTPESAIRKGGTHGDPARPGLQEHDPAHRAA